MKIFTNIRSVYLFIIFFCFLSSSISALSYKLVDLGLQESDRSEAVAVNDNGQVAGAYWLFEKKHNFIWDEREGIVLIDLPETATIVVLNNAGQIAGNYKDAAGHDRGFFWDPCYGICDIGTLGGNFTHIYDMNDHGQIVGESGSKNLSLVDGQGEVHAFLWQCCTMTDLGALVGDLGIPGDHSQATSINNQGQIIGTANALLAHKRKFLRTNERAVFWQNGVIEELDPTVEPQYSAKALNINDCGLAIYEDNKLGVFVVDIKIKNKIAVPFAKNLGRRCEIANNGDLFFSMNRDDVQYKRVADVAYFTREYINIDCENWKNYEYMYFANSFGNSMQWKPNSFEGAYDFNIHRWVVGVAENIYGERHAVLLVPVSEQIEHVEEEVVQSHDENDPEALWESLPCGSEKLKPEPTESERLTDILVKYGNNPEGVPTLQYAILQNDVPAVDLLLKHKSSPHTQDTHGADCLYYSVRVGNIELVKKFLALGVNPNGQLDSDEYKPLKLALENNRNDIAKLLIDAGVDLTKDSRYKPDYLRYCCQNTNFEITKLLVESGATANNSDELFRLLVVDDGLQEDSHEARKLKMEMIDYLVRENVIDIDKKISFTGKDLQRIFPEALSYILRNGLLDFGKINPIAFVAASPYYATELVSLVVSREPYINPPHAFAYLDGIDTRGMSAFHYLVQGTFIDDEAFDKRKELIEHLIGRGAVLDRNNNEGKTPLALAQDPKMIQFLQKIGAKYQV